MSNKFSKDIKKNRDKNIPSPSTIVENCYCELGYSSKEYDYFCDNASKFILNMREKVWDKFKTIEQEFSLSMAESLIDNKTVSEMKPVEAINYYLINNLDNLYALNLSNTNSRRSRAGKEFELILEKLFEAADIKFETQASIGKLGFMSKEIGKMVDFIFPDAQTFFSDKRSCVALSAKTSLRERWQEVGEEIARTGLRDMYLATLEQSFSENVLKSMNEHNIVPVVLKDIKLEKYKEDNRIIDYEAFLSNVKNL